MPADWNDDEYERQGKLELFAPGKSYPGQSNRNEYSDWRDMHLAIQRAAASAANDGEEGWFDVALHVWVGNPNIKIYGAILTKSQPPGDR